MLDGAVLSAIRMQEQAGLDYVSDGELRRNTYLHVFIDAVDGYEPDIIPAGPFSTSPIPAIVSPIVQRRSLCGSAPGYLVANAASRTIATLPSPYTLGVTMWTAGRSSAAYASPAEAMRACAKIINAEVKRLIAAGVDVVQIDDPWLGDVANPAYRLDQGIDDLDRELDLYVEAVNSSLEGAEGVSTAVHVCGHTSPTSPGSAAWPYDVVFEALGRMNVDRFTIAMSGPNVDGFKALAHYPEDKVLGLGVLNTIRTGRRDSGRRHCTRGEGHGVRARRADRPEPRLRLLPVPAQPPQRRRRVPEVEGHVRRGANPARPVRLTAKAWGLVTGQFCSPGGRIILAFWSRSALRVAVPYTNTPTRTARLPPATQTAWVGKPLAAINAAKPNPANETIKPAPRPRYERLESPCTAKRSSPWRCSLCFSAMVRIRSAAPGRIAS